MKFHLELNGYEVAKKALEDILLTTNGEDYLVRIGVKGSSDESYRYSTELLLNEGRGYTSAEYIWQNEWWKGEPDIDIVWAASISEFKIAPTSKYDMDKIIKNPLTTA